MNAVLRVIIGLLVSSLVAGVVLVVHVAQLLELAAAPPGELPPRLLALGQLTALYTTQIAMFLVPFGLLLAAVAEINRWRSWLVYVVFGLALAGAGYVLQYQSEGDLRTIVNPFAAQVFALQGIVGGLAYWLMAGRYAGWRRGGGLQRADPYAVDRPRLQIAEATEPTAKPALAGAERARTEAQRGDVRRGEVQRGEVQRGEVQWGDDRRGDVKRDDVNSNMAAGSSVRAGETPRDPPGPSAGLNVKPTTAVATTSVPTTSVPTTSVPTTSVPTAGSAAKATVVAPAKPARRT